MKIIKRRKAKRFSLMTTILTIILLGVLIFSSSKIISHELDLKENKKINEKTKKYINDNKVDFDELKKQNSDTIGYIKVNNTNIEYVVVKTNNNDFYLNHNFNKDRNIAGWIFVDYRNKVDESDRNLIIYGHNMKDGSMFDSLINVLKEKWYTNEDNHIITFITEKNVYKYDVFSTYSIDAEDYYITTEFSNDKNYLNFLNKLKSRSNYDYNIKLTSEDKILTLSSCIGDGKKRVVLHAKLIGG